jgi:hypothetical protein
MKRRAVLLCLGALPLSAFAQMDLGSLTSAVRNPLMGMLTSQLGVSESQATGGIGSYLTLAKEKLSKGNFDKISSLVPGASNYIEQARSLGAVTGPLKNLAGLNGALGKLGISSETASQFVPMITDYLGKAGGSSVQSMLGAMLK